MNRNSSTDLLLLLVPTWVLLVPIALTLRFRRAALLAERADPVTVLFSHYRRQQIVILITLGLWGLAIFGLDLNRIAQRVGKTLTPAWASTFAAAYVLLPPALVLAWCKGSSYPVYARARELGWTRENIWRQAIAGTAIWYSLVFLGPSGDAAEAGNSKWAFLWVLIGFGVFCVALSVWTTARGQVLQPTVLTAGPLLERTRVLAEKASVRVSKVLVFPAIKWRLIGFFAESGSVVSGSAVHVTAPLVRFLSQREVDSLIAHQLVWHWRRYVRNLWVAFIAIAAMAAAVAAAVGLTVLGRGTIETVCVAVGPVAILLMFLYTFRLRRFGPELDAAAVQLTGDAEALITALVKLHRHDLLPVYSFRWDPDRNDPISLWQRLEAIAERANIPEDRLQEILDNPNTGSDSYPSVGEEPTVADATAEGKKLLSPEYIQALNLRLLGAILLAYILVPALVAWLAQSNQARGMALVGFWLGGIVGAFLLARWTNYWFVAWSSRDLKGKLLAKLEQEGLVPIARKGVFVGLAPGTGPRVFDGCSTWDLGFLFLAGDWLGYLGDQARFVLRRDQVLSVYLGPGIPAWRSVPHVYVSWQDEEQGTKSTFNLSLEEAGPRRRTLAKFVEQLQQWHNGPAPADSLPEPVAQWGSPQFGPVRGIAIREHSSFAGELIAIGILEILAVGVCFALGLSFNPQQAGAALYVLGVVAILGILQYVPYWLYRDPGETVPASGSRP